VRQSASASQMTTANSMQVRWRQPTPWHRILLEKLMVSQLVEMFSTL